MANHNDNKRFCDSVIGDLLDSSIGWINANMAPEDVFEKDTLIDFVRDAIDIGSVYTTPVIVDFVRETCTPDEVFSLNDLAAWAEDNGWMKQPH